MTNSIDSYTQIAEELKMKYPNFTNFELLTLAIQIERNKLLENGLNINRNNSNPAALEAIAIAIGFK